VDISFLCHSRLDKRRKEIPSLTVFQGVQSLPILLGFQKLSLFIEQPKIVRQGWPKENPHFLGEGIFWIFGFLWV
jgi:hypothetical protein